MGAFAVLGIVVDIIVKIAGAIQEQERDRLIRRIASNTERINLLPETIREILRQVVAENEVYNQASAINDASDEYEFGNLDEAHDYARGAADRLMQPDLETFGLATFLLAAGVDIAILQKMAAVDRSNQRRLRSFADRYRRHAIEMWPRIVAQTRDRISIQQIAGFLSYSIDGQPVSRRLFSPETSEYYNRKADFDTRVLGGAIIDALGVAEKTWHAIRTNTAPRYGAVFNRGIVIVSDPPTAWNYVTGQNRIQVTHETALHLTPVRSHAALPVLRGISKVGTLPRGAKAIRNPDGQMAFILRDEVSIALFDNESVASANHSRIEDVHGIEFDRFRQVCTLEAYKYAD